VTSVGSQPPVQEVPQIGDIGGFTTPGHYTVTLIAENAVCTLDYIVSNRRMTGKLRIIRKNSEEVFRA